MRKNFYVITSFLLFVLTSFAQTNIPLIKANSKKISIRDGDQSVTKYWDYLSTTIKPVVYNISKTNKKRHLVFYTDIDSIAFDISPNNKYDFKVLLHSKDTCYVQISTIIPRYYINCQNCVITTDSIPFTLGNDQYIHIKGKVNDSKTLDFIFDTGASCVLLTESGLKKAKIKLDGFTDNQGSGGFSIEQTSNANHLELSKLEWKNLPLLYINYKGSLKADGVIGFNIFEDKVVEIDYDKKLLIIHSQLPLNKAGYAKLEMHHDLNGSFIQATLNNGQKDSKGWFLFDTGGNLTVVVNADFSLSNKLFGTMKKLGSSQIEGTGKNIISSETVLLPRFKLMDNVLSDVPVLLQGSNVNTSGNAGIIGNGVLKRFNVLIDYPDATIYLKPNSLFNTSFERNDNRILKLLCFAGVFIILVIGLRYLQKTMGKK